MYRNITRVSVAVAAAATLSTVGIAEASASGAASHGPQAARPVAAQTSSHAAAVPGAQLWVQRYNGPGNGFDAAASVAVSPGGRTVFVTGTSTGAYATVAYNAATGARLWASRYKGPGGSTAASVVVSPDGGTVFVTGTSEGTTSGDDYATVAYSAATGAQLWARRYDGPIHSFDAASAVAAGPTGTMVFVTGTVTAASGGAPPAADYGTVAYSAATGAQLWARLYNGSRQLISPEDRAFAVAVSPAGGKVFVTGESLGGSVTGYDYATVAYSTTTGARLWVSRYNGPKNGPDRARALAVSRGGQQVFVTGSSGGTSPYADYATVAYSTTTGGQLWARRYNGPVKRDDLAYSVAVSCAGKVFVTGQSLGSIRPGYFPGFDYATIAYSG